MINTKKFRRHSCIVAVFYLVMMPFTSIADVYNLTVDKVIIDTGKFKNKELDIMVHLQDLFYEWKKVKMLQSM